MAGFAPSIRALWRRYGHRQLRAFGEALAWRDYSERRYQWELNRQVVSVLGGKLDDFPDYVSPEEGQLSPEAIEDRLDAFLASGAFRM